MSRKHDSIIAHLQLLRDSFLNAPNCFKVYLLLKAVWPEAEAWYDGNHVIVKIGAFWYDWKGYHPGPGNSLKMVDYYPEEYKEARHWKG